MASLMMRYYGMTKGPQKPILVHSNISFFVQKLPYTTLATHRAPSELVRVKSTEKRVPFTTEFIPS